MSAKPEKSFYELRLEEALSAIQYTPVECGVAREEYHRAETLRREIVSRLEELLRMMPSPSVYCVYGINVEFETTSLDEFIAKLKELGYEQDGVETSKQRRIELQGAPHFKGLCGPMWDGNKRIRYDTPELYDILSK